MCLLFTTGVVLHSSGPINEGEKREVLTLTVQKMHPTKQLSLIQFNFRYLLSTGFEVHVINSSTPLLYMIGIVLRPCVDLTKYEEIHFKLVGFVY